VMDNFNAVSVTVTESPRQMSSHQMGADGARRRPTAS